MFRKIRGNKNVLALALMIFISCLIQVLTIMKSSIVAGYFGTSAEMDAFNFSFNIVTFIFSFVAAGISTIVIPEYVRRNNRKEVDSFLTAVFGVLLIISMIIILIRTPLVSILTNRDENFVILSGNILIILFISYFLSSITNVTGAYFQCENRFNTPKVINLIAQLAVVIVLLVHHNISIYEYSWIIAGGLLVNFIIDTLVALKLGWRYKPSFRFNDKTKHFADLFIPVLVSTGIYRISLLVDTVISSRLDAGSITILSYSNQISGMVNSLIIGNLLIYCYPKIVKNINENRNQSTFWNQTVFFHAVLCLIILGFAAVGQEGISLLFEHGKFKHDATMTVYYCCLIYIFGQQSNVIRDLVYRYFYALGDTITAAKNSVLIGIINIVISILLSMWIGLYGIVLGTIIASAVSLIAILIKFKRIIGFEIVFLKVIKTYVSSELIMIASMFIVFITKKYVSIQSNIISILIFGIESIVLFIVLTYLFNKKVIRASKYI
ncbi:MAG: polysaccharide biosynthesis C-terminal domain-containing protein [Butyrivibrio sp.]|nr:polysaccharide biosynthesis C-terminal domain-containing protein [Butyrivibrio sp.]